MLWLILVFLLLLGVMAANQRIAAATANNTYFELVALPACWLIMIVWLLQTPHGMSLWIVHAAGIAALIAAAVLLVRQRRGLMFYAPYAAFNLLLVVGLWILAGEVDPA